MTTATLEEIGLEKGWLRQSMGPLLIAAAGIVLLAIIMVFSFQSAWQLLGAGRGLVKPDYYHYVALLILLGTTFGQFVGWAAGSALLTYFLHAIMGRPLTIRLVQVSMTVVYLGLAVLPLFFYHVLFGQPLGGEPRTGFAEWLGQSYPEAYRLLVNGHPIVDFSLIPLAIGVLAVIWGFGDRALRQRNLQILLLFLIFATSFAVALSLAIHSTLAHIRIAP